MDTTLLQKRLARANQRVKILEKMIETSSRELFLAHEETRATNDFLHALHQILPCCLLLLDEQGIILNSNQTTQQVLGSYEGHLKNTDLRDVQLDPFDDLTCFEEEQQWRTRQGQILPMLVSIRRLKKPGKNGEAMVCIAQHLSLQKRFKHQKMHHQDLSALGHLTLHLFSKIQTHATLAPQDDPAWENIKHLSQSITYFMSAVEEGPRCDLHKTLCNLLFMTGKDDMFTLDFEQDLPPIELPRQLFQQTLLQMLHFASETSPRGVTLRTRHKGAHALLILETSQLKDAVCTLALYQEPLHKADQRLRSLQCSLSWSASKEQKIILSLSIPCTQASLGFDNQHHGDQDAPSQGYARFLST